MFIETKTVEEKCGDSLSHFDWWQATIDPSISLSSFEELPKYLSSQFPSSDWRRNSGRHGYAYRDVLVRGETPILTLHHGGYQPLPNIEASGSSSGAVRDVVTSLFPSGKVSRVDSAFDSESGTAEFERVTTWAESVATEMGIKCRWIKNSDKTEGDTLYIGAKTSRVQIRIYEKGKQMSFRPDKWWRAEVQLRPDTRGKETAYHYSSGSVWSASRMTRALWSYLGGERLAAVGFQAPSEHKDLNQRLLAMAIQYGNLLSEAMAVHGDGSDVINHVDQLLQSSGREPITGRVPNIPNCPF